MAEVTFYGETFKLSGSISEFALMEFAEAADDGQDSDTMQGMASMLRLIKDCIAEDDWGRFRKLAREKRADIAALTPVLQAAMEQVTERPTGRPSDLSDGPEVIEPKFELPVVDPVMANLAGRPDLQLAVTRYRQTA